MDHRIGVDISFKWNRLPVNYIKKSNISPKAGTRTADKEAAVPLQF
jgi:hypothetical protein